MKKLRALLTAATGPGGAGIINSLKRHPLKEIDVVAGNVEDIEDSSMILAKEKIIIPYVSDNQFVSKMLDICIKNKIDLLIPAFSEECLKLSHEKQVFENVGIKVLVPTYENVAVCHDKKMVNNILFKKYPEIVIPSIVVKNTVELEKACYQLGYPKEKLCVKPVVCNGGSRGFYILDESYDRIHNFYFEKQPNKCSLEELILKFKGETSIPELMVMKYIQGTEYGIDVVAQNGKIISSIIRRKLNPILSSMNMRVEIIEDERLNQLVHNVAEELKLNSIVNFDILLDEDNVYVIEINPRQSAYVGTSAQKVNLLAIAIDLLYGEEINLEKYKVSYKNVMSVRYIEEFAICDDIIVPYKR